MNAMHLQTHVDPRAASTRKPRWLAARSLTLCLSLTICALANAQVETDLPVERKDYRVELVVFEFLGDSPSEDWQSARGDSEDEQTTASRSPKAALRFEKADPAGHTLNEVAAKLRGSRDYRPLLHTAWIQPGYSAEEAPSLALDRIARANGGLRGNVTLHVSRYLHLRLDLSMPATSAAASNQTSLTLNERPTYKLSESRRIRSGELHFFDHPKFGVLARIEPVDADNTP